MRDERKMYVLKEEVGIGIVREIEDMNVRVVAAKGSKKNSNVGHEKETHPDLLLSMGSIYAVSLSFDYFNLT